MSEIKFRGKTLLTNRWVYGHYAYVYEEEIKEWYHIIFEEGIPQIVQRLSVNQYTGLKDKNGREIYEGDFVEYTRIVYADCSRTEIEDIEESIIGEVYYAEGLWIGVRFIDGTGKLFLPGQVSSEDNNLEIEIIGNIHENPELLGDE